MRAPPVGKAAAVKSLTKGTQLSIIFYHFILKIHFFHDCLYKLLQILILVIGYSNVSFHLSHGSGKDVGTEWWKLQEEVKGDIFNWDVDSKPHAENQLSIITFNDRVAPATLSFLSTYG